MFLSFLSYTAVGQYFVAPLGSDNNPGTFDQPFATITKAHSVVAARDTIYVRGGVYTSSIIINLSKAGAATTKYHLLAYPGERPILDFSSMIVGSSNRGIRLSGSHWHIRGLDVKGAGDNGMYISGSNNVVENCAFYENRDTGLQIGSGASNNRIINCDSYYNVDPAHGNADGFAAKLDVGSGNYFIGCRAWQNSDDGWDGYLRGANDVTTVLDNCWVFRNGYLKGGSPSSGNGNGIKMGGSDDRTLRHNITIIKCLTFDNRIKGFDQNNNRGSMTLYHCTAYRNGTNYSVNSVIDSGKRLTVVNSLALGNYGSLASFAVQMTNSWHSQFTVTNDDFLSIDTTGVTGPRKADGSLPDLPFMRLANGSDLIDAGTDIGLPYSGRAPDLGAFETGLATWVEAELSQHFFVVAQSYPNPFNPETNIVYELPERTNLSVCVYDLVGRMVKELVNREHVSGRYTIQWNGTDLHGVPVTAGTYFAAIRTNCSVKILKLLLMK